MNVLATKSAWRGRDTTIGEAHKNKGIPKISALKFCDILRFQCSEPAARSVLSKHERLAEGGQCGNAPRAPHVRQIIYRGNDCKVCSAETGSRASGYIQNG